MNFCEKCNLLVEGERCDYCGNANLREVKSDDFCFLIECENTVGKSLEEALKRENIPSALVPCGNGVNSFFALPLGNFKIYVPYESYEKALEICNFFLDDTNYIKDELIENFHRWHTLNEKTEKKFRKTLKRPDGAALMDHIKEEVLKASYIKDAGKNYSSTDGGNYLVVRSDEITLMFNSATFELISVIKNS